jgi:predicted AlkP superfamily phosphohydrolase/phosphomutase
MIIGLDGATFHLIKPWLAEGLLPNLSNMVRSGVSAELMSALPSVTANSWVSFMTGKNPGKHGIFDFEKFVENSYETVTVNANMIDGDTIWQWISKHGKSVGCINVPITYPPQKVKGFMISDWLAPPGIYTYPPKLKQTLRDIGGYTVHVPQLSQLTRKSFLKKLFEIEEKKEKVAIQLLKKYDLDVFMIVFGMTDWVQHHFWKYIDPKCPGFRQREAEKWRNTILECYQKADNIIGNLLRECGDETIIFIMSDHGFGPIYQTLHVNAWLEKIGFLKLRIENKRKMKSVDYWLSKFGLTRELAVASLLKVSERLTNVLLLGREKVGGYLNAELSYSDIDWEQTKAYARGHLGQIYVNLKGREPRGIVKPGEEYEAVRDDIIHQLQELNSPDGKKIVTQVYRKEEIYHGSHLRNAPDIVYETAEGIVPYNGVELNRNSMFSAPTGIQSGMHRKEGLLIITGKNIRKGVINNPKIMDLAPTILFILGVPIPHDMDGRVLTDIFEPSFINSHAIKYAGMFPVRKTRPFIWSKEDEEEVKERLKRLGYL